MGTALKILHLEDNPDDAELARSVLASEGIVGEWVVVDTRESFSSALEGAVDLVLADFTLPSFDGWEALEIARRKAPQAPFIFLTGTLGEDVAIESLKRGATDYVLKNRLPQLAPAIRRALEEAGEHRRRTAAEAELRESEERFHAIFENVKDGLLLVDVASKRFMTGNQSICHMLGYTQEELRQLGVGDIHPREDLEEIRAAFESQARGDLGMSTGVPVLRRDGSIFFADISSTPVEMGGTTYLVGVFRDITERRKADEELRHRLEELERFRKATTQREFRIKELKERVRKLESEVRQLRTLPQPGGAVPAPAAVESRPRAEALRVMGESSLGEDELRILLLEDSLDDVALIERQLHACGLRFRIVAVETEEDFLTGLKNFGPDIVLADYVLPSYDGLSALRTTKQLRPDLPFILVSGAIGRDFAGECLKSGASSYVAKDRLWDLVPAMREALPGIGARAGLRRGAADGPQGGGYEGRTDAAGSPPVLVITGDQDLCRSLPDVLTAGGYAPLAVRTGAEGIRLLRRHPLKAAIVDLRLSDMSGMDVLGVIRDERPLVQAVALTDEATPWPGGEAARGGVFSYLRKPCDAEQLLLLLRRAVERQRTEERLISQGVELQISNTKLKAFYDISQSISKTIEMAALIPEILQTVTGIEIFNVERRGAIFLLERDMLRLASHAGFTDAEWSNCRNVRPGECLCGLAAATGEIILSKNSVEDLRHTRSHPGAAAPHGNIIVPLKTARSMEGVLCLYTKAGVEVDITVLDLLFSIGNQIGTALANSRLYEETRTSSFHDPLTGLANRRLMDVMLQKSCARAGRFGTSLTLVMIDIDHFKAYNDTYGHLAGDKMLAEVARIVACKTRTGDLAVRYGGEEFLLLFHQVDLKKTQAVAEMVRAEVESALGITISLGVSAYADGISPEEFIAQADRALYQAKTMGRNRVVALDPAL